MSLLERSIISIIEPDFKVLKLEPVIMTDKTPSEEASKQLVSDPPGSRFLHDPTMQVGVMTPWISINTLVIQRENLIYLEIDLNGKIPTVMATFKDSKNELSMDAPLDTGIISVYIKPPDHENQRPIRCDFSITSFDGNPKSRTYVCSGILRLPNFFGEVCKSFKSDTSFNHLKKMCQDLGIGYASNEDATSDLMTRFIPFENYEFFIDETVTTSYKDDDSFFDWYIDPWYYLCFVNVNKQFEIEDKFEKVNITSWPPMSAAPLGTDGSANQVQAAFMVSNLHPYSTSNLGIRAYNIVNYAGDVSIKNGYKRTGYWLNIDGKTILPENAYSEALTTPGSEENFILLKGRKQDDGGAFDYREWSKASWLGKQSLSTNSGNVHENYAYSKILNHQNLEELRKTNLTIDMIGMNFYIYKYQKIPVAIYESSVEENKYKMLRRNEVLDEEPNGEPEEGTSADNYNRSGGGASPTNEASQIFNGFLSGYYIVGGIKYIWEKGTGYMRQQLSLIRREWPIPSQNNMP
jgi:hypothetical protein